MSNVKELYDMKKILFPIWSALLLCLASCDKLEAPTVGDLTVSDVASNGVRCSVIVNGDEVTECGFYYGTSKVSVNNDKGSKVQATQSEGSFSTVITGLAPNTTYYIKGYAMNSAGRATTALVEVKTLANVPEAGDNQYPEVSK